MTADTVRTEIKRPRAAPTAEGMAQYKLHEHPEDSHRTVGGALARGRTHALTVL
jgi:hypothetical protein